MSVARRRTGVRAPTSALVDAALAALPSPAVLVSGWSPGTGWARLGVLPVSLATEGTARPLDSGVDLAACRVVQEGLTNALKYAGGASTEATVPRTPCGQVCRSECGAHCDMPGLLVSIGGGQQCRDPWVAELEVASPGDLYRRGTIALLVPLWVSASISGEALLLTAELDGCG